MTCDAPRESWPEPLRWFSVDPRGDAVRWAKSGGMILTGMPDGPPLVPPAPVASVLEAAGAIIDPALDAPALVGERLLSRHGAVSCGGRTRLLPASDGWMAVALARPTDLDAVPAWLGIDPVPHVDEAWGPVATALASQSVGAASASASELEIPASGVGSLKRDEPWTLTRLRDGRPLTRPPVVLDLSALWAGPLCASLIGGRTVKVEDPRRPDGARYGDRRLFDLLNGAKLSVATEMSSPILRRLLEEADVVVSSSRPRAFEQLGIDVPAILSHQQTVWVAITAYGWSGADHNRVGFGDDVAAAAGLVATSPSGDPVFVADAVADPLCGVLAAAAARACLAHGGSWLIDASLAGAAGYTASLAPTSITRQAMSMIGSGWTIDTVPVAPARARPVVTPARQLGADTAEVLGRLH